MHALRSLMAALSQLHLQEATYQTCVTSVILWARWFSGLPRGEVTTPLLTGMLQLLETLATFQFGHFLAGGQIGDVNAVCRSLQLHQVLELPWSTSDIGDAGNQGQDAQSCSGQTLLELAKRSALCSSLMFWAVFQGSEDASKTFYMGEQCHHILHRSLSDSSSTIRTLAVTAVPLAFCCTAATGADANPMQYGAQFFLCLPLHLFSPRTAFHAAM